MDCYFSSDNGNVSTCIEGLGCAPRSSLVLADGTKPSGATTQWLTFTFYTTDFFTATENHSHFAIGLRGNMTSNSLEGRGIIIGDVHLRNDGQACTNHPTIEAESFWSSGNRLFPDTCHSVTENTPYNVTIHVADNHYIAYWITDQYGKIVFQTGAQDPDNYISDNYGQVWITLASNAPNSTWTICLSNVATGWF